MKVYIAYGTAADQVTGLRLQALAAVNGLTVFVPPAHTRQATSLPEQDEDMLRDSDVFLGVVGVGLSEACRQLNLSQQLGKATLVFADPTLAAQVRQYFQGNLIAIDPADPAQAEVAMVRNLKSMGLDQESGKALLALSTLAIGLMLFASQD
ncbi:MAG: hypothetical protein ACRD8O_17420 [Bryobacteraceae bacterium]